MRKEPGLEEGTGSREAEGESKKPRRAYRKISGDNSERDPPVPIPNTEVKPLSADGTWLATARESRTSPGSRERLERQECFSNTPITGKRERAEPE